MSVLDEPSELMTTDEVAAETRVPATTLKYWRVLVARGEENQGPPFARVGKRRILYRRREVRAWLDSHFETTATG